MTAAAFPKIPDGFSIPYVAATMVIMSYSALFSIVPILVFFAIWLPHFYYRRVFILRPSADLVISLLLPFVAFYSFFWSDYPGKSAYAGLEYIAMVVCTLLIARLVTIPALLKGITFGVSVTMVITLANGSYGRDMFSGGYALVGLFGSKNVVGFISEIGIFVSLIILTMRIPKLQKLIFGLIPLAICAVCFYMSRSSSSYASMVAVLATCAGAWLLTRLPVASRPLGLGLAFFALLTVGAITMASGLNVQEKVLNSLGKDSTLTGRTYLWSEGIKVGQERPVLGHGYSAFWVAGQPQAEKYWHEFYIPNPTGFHFHNLFIQSFVDLGFVGLAIAGMLLLMNCGLSLARIVANGMVPEYTLALGLSIMFLIRAMVEVDWLVPFGIGPLLFFIILPLLRRDSADSQAI
ncbi:MAG: Exopolysaccharide production protein ExoQ [Micavibrio sp.]|nr:Exopolysaccharide production protein ExoQ [Micavibrio sp.]